MRLRWGNLNELDRAAYSTMIAFLNGRLEERATVDWALKLKPKDWVSRMVLLDLIDRRKISEPWQSAWRLIEESWDNPVLETHASKGVHDAKRRLHAGDRSGSLVTAIVDCVAPKLKIEPFSSLDLRFRKPPKKVEDLFSTRLTSGEPVEPGLLKLETLTDETFLLSLALALDATVTSGLDIARRIARDGKYHLQELGTLHRVYYVKSTELADGNNEPDKFHKGIAPAVKLLHAVVSRLVNIDISKAIEFVRRWKLANSPVHLRLWAALSQDPRVTPASETSKVLLSLDNERFWELHDFPEIAELRSKRFHEFDPQEQAALTARIRKLPPSSQWPKKAAPDQIKKQQLYCAVREMRRIEFAGATLSQRDQTWLAAKIQEFPDLRQMARIDEGFPGSPQRGLVPPITDNRYDLLAGEDRLRALEASLSSARAGWGDDPARRAGDWIRQQGNPVKVLADFESIPDGGTAFVRIWERFGWAHSPAGGQGEDAAQRDFQSECSHVLSLLVKLQEVTVRQAINGISAWLSTWKTQVVVLPEGFTVWLKCWPIAVEATNAEQPVSEDFDLNTVEPATDDHQPMDFDTLNTPAGKLVGVFLAACPTLQEDGNPFDGDDVLRRMRDAIIATTGQSGLIAQHRMIEELPYFLNAAQDWTHQHLIMPLNADNTEAIALWRAIGRRTHFSDVLEIIGDQMAKRATDQRLDRETRQSLVFSLIIECLHAFHEHREPTVPFARVQQMIRSVDDEVRAHGAEAIQRFVRDLSAPSKRTPNPPSPEKLFQSAAAPFLQQVWPQERSLATPGVSQVLADLPATAKKAFAEAVNAIERFLVPFECWSILEYGLYGKQDEIPEISIIDNQKKADALLRLLDLTVGTAEGSVVPDDLGDALEQIRRIAPNLKKKKAFRRLSTAARR